MKYGKNKDYWLSFRDDDENHKFVYDIIKDCDTVENTIQALIDNEFEIVQSYDTRGSGRVRRLANNNHSIIDVYMFQRKELSITIKYHGFKDVKALVKCWDFCEVLSEMTPWEMQQ